MSPIFEDFHFARIQGALSFQKDFIFKNKVTEYANILTLDTYKDFKDIEIDINKTGDQISIKYNDSPSFSCTIEPVDLYYKFGSCKISDLTKKKSDLFKYIRYVDKTAEHIKSPFLKKFIGCSIDIVIPYVEDNVNLMHFKKVLNENIISGFFPDVSEEQQNISLWIRQKNNILFNSQLSNIDNKYLIIKNDFRFDADHEYALSNFFTKIFNKKHLSWLKKYVKYITNNYEKVDYEGLQSNNI